MPSKMEIINRALANLAREPIQSLSEANPEAFQLRMHWESSLASILRDHPWGFATRRTKLALLADAPVGFSFAYAYPADCILARRVCPALAVVGRRGVPFEIGRSPDGRHKAILTDLPEAALEYTSSQVPAEEFDPQFAGALSWRLSAEMSLALHADPAAHQAAVATYAAQLQQAKAMDMRESHAPRLPDGDFLLARR